MSRLRLPIRARCPFLPKRRRVVWWARWAADQPGAAKSYLYGGIPGIGTGTHTDCSGFVVASTAAPVTCTSAYAPLFIFGVQ